MYIRTVKLFWKIICNVRLLLLTNKTTTSFNCHLAHYTTTVNLQCRTNFVLMGIRIIYTFPVLFLAFGDVHINVLRVKHRFGLATNIDWIFFKNIIIGNAARAWNLPVFISLFIMIFMKHNVFILRKQIKETKSSQIQKFFFCLPFQTRFQEGERGDG